MRRSKSADGAMRRADLSVRRMQELRELEAAVRSLASPAHLEDINAQRASKYSRGASIDREMAVLDQQKSRQRERSLALPRSPHRQRSASPTSRSVSPSPRSLPPPPPLEVREEALRRLKFSKRSREGSSVPGIPAVHMKTQLEREIGNAVAQGRVMCDMAHFHNTRALEVQLGNKLNEEARRALFCKRQRRHARDGVGLVEEKRATEAAVQRELRVEKEKGQLEAKLRREKDMFLLEQRLLQRDLAAAKEAEKKRIIREAYLLTLKEHDATRVMSDHIDRDFRNRAASATKFSHASPMRAPGQSAIPSDKYRRLLGCSRTDRDDYVEESVSVASRAPSVTRSFLASSSPRLRHAVSKSPAPAAWAHGSLPRHRSRSASPMPGPSSLSLSSLTTASPRGRAHSRSPSIAPRFF